MSQGADREGSREIQASLRTGQFGLANHPTVLFTGVTETPRASRSSISGRSRSHVMVTNRHAR